VVASLATAVWSAAQMATGAAAGVVSMLAARLGLGIGEAPFSPIIYRSVRAWAPYTANATLTSDLLRSPADAGRAFAFLVLGGNTFGLIAPIATGYLVSASGNFSSAFIAAGALALIGAVVTLTLSRGAIGEVAMSTRPIEV